MRHGAELRLVPTLAEGAAPVAAACANDTARPAPERPDLREAAKLHDSSLYGAASLRALPPPAPQRDNQPAQPVVPPLRSRAATALAALAGLALLWAGLTGGSAEGWLFGLPAVLAGAAIAWRLAPPAHLRLSAIGALRFAGWFAVQAVRGAVDVAARAFHPRLPVAPGWRRHPQTLPPGAPRLVMANAITLLPGTLTAEFHDDHLLVHMLDSGTDLAADLAALEARVRALFALPPAEAMPANPETRP